MSGTASPGYRFSIAVWGRGYVDLLCGVTLPSLMAPGNLPAFGRRLPIRVCVYGPASDVALVEASPIWALIEREIGGECVAVDGAALADPYSGMTELHERAIEDAKRLGAGLVLQNADAFWGDGCLEYMAEEAERGAELTMAGVLRVDVRAIQGCFAGRVRRAKRGAALAAPVRELGGAALRSMHPTQAAMAWSAGVGSGFDSMNWLGGRGLACLHMAHLVPMTIAPSAVARAPRIESTVDQDYVHRLGVARSAVALLDDPDRFCMVEMSDRYRYAEAIDPLARNTPAKSGGWLAEHGGAPFSGRLYRKPTLVGGAQADERAVMRASSAAALAALVTAESMVAARKLAALGAGRAARWLALWASAGGVDDAPTRAGLRVHLPGDAVLPAGWRPGSLGALRAAAASCWSGRAGGALRGAWSVSGWDWDAPGARLGVLAEHRSAGVVWRVLGPAG
ncbi:MAG: hypothetical protein AAGA57_03420 [Planctomycetota bacterium]